MELVEQHSNNLSSHAKSGISFFELPFDHLLVQDGDGNNVIIVHRETLEVLNNFKFTDAIIVDVKPMFKGLCLFSIH